MKISIAFAVVISFFLLAIQPAQAQHRTRTIRRSTMMRSDTSTTSPVGAEVSGVTGAAPGDPYNVNHPFFRGNSRWSDADTMYKHGDFPWALVKDHPSDFQFDAASGKWQVTNTADLQKSR